MPRKRNIVLVGSAFSILALVLGAGLAAGFFGSGASNVGTRSNIEGLPIGGVAYITVYNPQGKVVETWHGHNTVFGTADSAISNCISGAAAVGSPITGCTGFTGSIAIIWGFVLADIQEPCVLGGSSANFSPCSQATATNVLSPGGCSVSAGTCTGWLTSATFQPTDFTHANGCGVSCTIDMVVAAQGTSWTGYYEGPPMTSSIQVSDPGNGFDQIPTSIAITNGDSLAVNIQYTVS